VTVGRSHVFSLDDATLSGGAVIRDAGGGLPRRVMGARYTQHVIDLAPSGYWPLDEASGNFIDRSPNARDLTPTANYAVRRAMTYLRGGEVSYAINASGTGNSAASGTYPEHQIAVGTPFTMMFWWQIGNGASSNFAITNNGQVNPAIPGFFVRNNIGRYFEANFSSTTGAYATVKTLSYVYPFEWGQPWITPTILRYNGGALTSAASWSLRQSGVVAPLTVTASGSPANIGTGTLRVAYGIQSATTFFGGVAIWNNRRLTDAQCAILDAATPCGTARWTLPADAAQDRTLKGVQLPGRLARADLTRLGVRVYYQIGADPRVEFDPGDDLSVSIPAGAACYLDADLVHNHIDDLPWIADSLGGGPVALYEEPAPVLSVTVDAIHSRAGAIDVTLSQAPVSVATPTSDAQPAIQLGAATIAGAIVTIEDSPVYLPQPRAAIVRHAVVVSAAPRRVRVIHARRPTTVNP
jgi:hypothetical protein